LSDRALQDALEQIAEACREAREFAGDLTKEQLEANRMALRAVERSLEIIGEAAKRVSNKKYADFVARHPEVDWSGWAGFRDRLAHSYESIKYDYTWDILKTDLLVLEKHLPAIRVDAATFMRNQGGGR
jgi:uncharacterized protein with HEPN domain